MNIRRVLLFLGAFSAIGGVSLEGRVSERNASPSPIAIQVNSPVERPVAFEAGDLGWREL